MDLKKLIEIKRVSDEKGVNFDVITPPGADNHAENMVYNEQLLHNQKAMCRGIDALIDTNARLFELYEDNCKDIKAATCRIEELEKFEERKVVKDAARNGKLQEGKERDDGLEGRVNTLEKVVSRLTIAFIILGILGTGIFGLVLYIVYNHLMF